MEGNEMNIQGGYTYKDRCGKKDHIYIIMIQQIYNGTSKNMVYIKKKSSGAENIFQVSYIQFKQKQFYIYTHWLSQYANRYNIHV